MMVTVETRKGSLNVKASPLEVARLVASVTGWHLDGQESSSGAVLSASKGDASVKANGKSLNEAAENIIYMLSGYTNV